MVYGTVSDIQRFSLNDGPGIRTTVFLKGCNMRCLWCHNPESINTEKALEIYSDKCISCGRCYRACKTGAMVFGISIYDSPKTTALAPIFMDKYRKYTPDLCVKCGCCVDVCPNGALRLVGNKMSAQEVFDAVKGDMDYYESSQGGVTISGGEPTVQPAFLLEILHLCHSAGIDTAIETNLTADQDTLLKLLPYLDRIFCDFKVFDDTIHKKVTGVSNKRIMDNLRLLSNENIPVVVRTPLIPGISDGEENIRCISRWLVENTGVKSYELLNYNALAESKYHNLRMDYELSGTKRLKSEELDKLVSIGNESGILTICGER